MCVNSRREKKRINRGSLSIPPHCSTLRSPESSSPKGQILETKAKPQSWAGRLWRWGVGGGRRWKTIRLGIARGGHRNQESRRRGWEGRAVLPGPTWSGDCRGCPGHLRPLFLGFLPLPLLLLLDEAEVGAAELGSGGRGDQPRLQQHRGQAEEQGARDAPAEPRHGREPEGRGGILRSCGRRGCGLRGCGLQLRPPARAPSRSLPRTRSAEGGRGGGGDGAGGGGGS